MEKPKADRKGKLTPRDLGALYAAKIRERYKIPETARPEYEAPILPRNVSIISSKELGTLQGQFAAWANYVEDILAREDVDKWFTVTQEEYAMAVTRLEAKGSVQIKRDTAIIDNAEKTKRTTEKKAFVRLLTVKLNQFERARTTLSREQTRRELEWQKRRTT